MIRMSEWAAQNKQVHKADAFRMGVDAPAPFKSGDEAPCVVYSALVGTEGTAMRFVAERTRARVFSDHVVLDHFDPVMDLTMAPDNEPLSELVGYLVDREGKERLLFTLKMRRDK